MAVTYLPIEQSLISTFRMLYPATNGGPPVRQEFQFPPIVKSNLMSGTFTEESSNGDTNAPGIYPGYMYRGPNQREFTVETTYIIDGASWDNDKVISEVRKYRSYYFDLVKVIPVIGKQQVIEKAAILMEMWGFSGPTAMPVYMSNLSISHSGPLILPEPNKIKNNSSIQPRQNTSQADIPVVANAQYAFHLKTDVSFSLTLWVPYRTTAPNDNNKNKLPIIERTWH